jgi:uncharacterized membrane protein
MRWRRRLQLAAIIAFVVAYAGLSHYSNSAAKTHDLGVGLALGPLLTIGLLLVWRWTRLLVALLAAAAAALLLRNYWPVLEKNFPLVYLLQEGGFYSLMAASFGHSLLGQRQALCTQLADKVHGPLTPQEVLYTRRVTAAWALFFVLITAATLILFVFANLRVWSVFANFCVPPLIGLMFAGEYAVRRRVLPQVPRRGILAAVRIYFASSHEKRWIRSLYCRTAHPLRSLRSERGSRSPCGASYPMPSAWAAAFRPASTCSTYAPTGTASRLAWRLAS